MAPPERVVPKKLNPHERAKDEGLEIFDASETLEEEKEDEVDAQSESDENGDDDQDGEDRENAQVEEEPTEIPASTASNVNMVFLDKKCQRNFVKSKITLRDPLDAIFCQNGKYCC